MKKINILLIPLILFLGLQLHAQERYLSPVFTSVSVTADVVYGSNISVLRAPALIEPIDLLMDVYTPVGDTITDRPLVLFFHTGSFLPPLFSGQITGSRSDSTVVNICTRLAKLGYVAAAVTNRLGWVPTAVGPDGQNTRTSTLLQAAYRGIQDARSCVRFFRKTVAEMDNPYGVNPDKITVWGQGTGGYIALGAAYLDRFEEVQLDKFFNADSAQYYVDTTVLGNVYATTTKQLCLANHPSYSSDIALSVNMGGALGDISWIERPEVRPNQPPTIGFHYPNDPFAPYADGAVIVPVTNDFVVNVSGTRTVVDTANAYGLNDVFAAANAEMNELNARVTAYKSIQIQPPGYVTPINLTVDNLYPFITPSGQPASGWWDWWDKPTLDAVVFGTNLVAGTNFNADTLHRNGLLLHPNMSPELGKTYLDTIMNYFIPRAYLALTLDPNASSVKEPELTDADVNLTISPNPSQAAIRFETREKQIRDILLYDLNGRLVQQQSGINNYQFILQRNGLPPGLYIAKLRFKEGVISKKLMFR